MVSIKLRLLIFCIIGVYCLLLIWRISKSKNMKRKNFSKKALRILLSFIAVYSLVTFAVLYLGGYYHKYLPTYSTPNQLRITLNTELVPKDIAVSLIDSEGNSYILKSMYVINSEPQVYTLPKLSKGAVTVHLKFSDITNDFDLDVMKFDSSNWLKLKGLLIYFNGFFSGASVHIISGFDEKCYKLDYQSESWIADKTPPLITVFADGCGVDLLEYKPEWTKNDWEYYPASS